MNEAKNRKTSKIRLWLSLALSLVGVTVAAISSMAWFSITSAGKALNDDVSVTTGDSSLSISNINAYKSTYDQLDADTTDYSSSHVTAYNVKGSTAINNINQGAITGFDVPEQGVGYYLVGDETWAQIAAHKDESMAWKYAASIRMEDDAFTGASNKALARAVYLKEGMKFKIRHHYFSGSNIADDWLNPALDSNSYTTTALDISGGNFIVNDDINGYYDLFLLNDNNKISVYPRGDLVASAKKPAKKDKIVKRSEAALSTRVYFHALGSDIYGSSAWFAAYFCNGSSGVNWLKMTNYNSAWSDLANYYYADIPEGNYANVLFLRFDPNYTTYSGTTWPSDAGNKLWGQTNDLDVNGGQCYTSTGYSNSKMTGSWSSSFTLPKNKVETGTKLYVDLGTTWTVNDGRGDRMGAYFAIGGGSAWAAMSLIMNSNDYHIYECTVPQLNSADAEFDMVIFVLLKSSTLAWGDNNSNIWGQSINIEPTDGTYDCYTYTGATDGEATGSWNKNAASAYTSKFFVMGGYSGHAWESLGYLTFTGTQNCFSGTIKMAATKSFKVCDANMPVQDQLGTYYGWNHYLSQNTTYFQKNGEGDGDLDILCKEGKGCSFTLTYYSDTHNFRITSIEDLPTLYYKINVLKKAYDPTNQAYSSSLVAGWNYIVTGTEYDKFAVDTAIDTSEAAYTSNYTWNEAADTWYTDAACESEYTTPVAGGSDNTTNVKNLYTYVEEKTVTLTIEKSYLTEGDSSTSRYQDSAGTKTSGVVTAFPISTLASFKTSGRTGYTFQGFYSGTTASSTNYAENSSQSFTSAQTIYAVFQPNNHTVTIEYDFFDASGNPIASGPSISDGSVQGYESEDFIPSNTYGHNIYAYKNLDESAYYVFDRDTSYFYTDAACNAEHRYTSGPINAATTLHVKMTARAMTKIYLDIGNISNTYWKTHLVLFAYKDADNSSDTSWTGRMTSNDSTHMLNSDCFDLYANRTNSREFPDNEYVYQFSCPTDYSVTITNGYWTYENDSDSTHINQTVDIGLTTSSTDNHSTAKGTYNQIHIDNAHSGSGTTRKFTFSWDNFYSRPSPNAAGYYLVGSNSLTGGSSTEWTFASAKKLKTADLPTLPGLSGNVVAYFDNLTLSSGMLFQVWQYTTTGGRTNIFNTLNNDDESKQIATESGNNISVNSVSGSKFGIYLMDNNKIVIRDDDQSSYLIFNRNPQNAGKKIFEMGYGDHTNDQTPENYAMYEQGVQITQADIDAGLSFVLRDRRHGTTSWYGYDKLANDVPSTTTGATTTTSVYGDSTLFTTDSYMEDGKYGIKITEPGYYKFYLTGAKKVYVAPMPGEYGEGYYIVPYNSSDEGSNKTDYYTNGIKMKEISHGANIAVYTCYSVTDSNRSIFFRSYRNGVDTTVNAGNNTVYCNTLSSASSSLATMTDGVLTFTTAGSYNIYLYTENSTVKCAVTEYTKQDFFTLNSINKGLADQAAIKDARTGIVLEVDFTTTNSNYNVQAVAEMVATGSGSSRYIDFRYAVLSPNGSGDYVEDSFSTYDNCYEYMYARHYLTGTSYSPINLSSGNHKMFILVDYKASELSNLPSTATVNDFYFVMKMKQVIPS